MPIFQSIPVLNGLSKGTALVQKRTNPVLLKYSSHLKMKMTKNSNFKTFTASTLTLSARRAAGSTIGRCMLAEPSALYSYD